MLPSACVPLPFAILKSLNAPALPVGAATNQQKRTKYTLHVLYACGILRRMIKLRLSEMLKERGRTPYWLAKETGIRYASIWQMSKGDLARLHIDTLDLICEALDCQPGDLLVRVSARKATKKAKKRRSLWQDR